MIRYIFLDLDDTLLDFRRAEREALRQTLQQLGVEPTAKLLRRYHEINLQQWKLLEQGKLSRTAVKVRRYQLLFDEFGLSCDPAHTTEIYEQRLAAGHYFVEGAEQLLQTLSPQYALYVASNGSEQVQRSRMKSAGIERYFKQVFISETVGYTKPDRAFFDACFAAIPDFSPREAMIVGDSLSSDMLGGKNAGIATVWFNPRGEQNPGFVIPDAEIRSLSELPPLVDSWTAK